MIGNRRPRCGTQGCLPCESEENADTDGRLPARRDGALLHFGVVDRGPGFPAKLLARLWMRGPSYSSAYLCNYELERESLGILPTCVRVLPDFFCRGDRLL